MTQSAKRGLTAFPDNKVWLIITPDGFDVSPSYHTKSYSYVRGISGQNCRVVANLRAKLWAVIYMQLKRYKTRLGHIRSSSSPKDEGACNSAYSQCKRQNSNMADIS